VFDLTLLGRLDLRDAAGAEVRQLLGRPKLLALLAYLAAARPRGFHRRDTIVAVFWPELDQAHARNALRQAVHQLRALLGSDLLTTRGDEELAVNPSQLRCDVAQFDDLIAGGKGAEALALVRGDLLPGFHLSDAAEFERWLDEEREYLRREVAGAARGLARAEAGRGNTVGAAHWARRALGFAPYDEEMFRELLQLLDRAGDRAGAVQEYARFARQLEEDLGVEPSPETREVLDALRARADLAPSRVDAPAAHLPPPAPATVVGPAPLPTVPARSAGGRVPRLVWAGVVVAVVVGVAWASWPRRPRPGVADLRPEAPSVAVLPLKNLSGDPALDYVADGITEEVIGELGRLGGLRVISRTSVMQFRDAQLPVPVIADSLDVEHVLEGGVVLAGDRIRVVAQLIRARPERHVWSETYDRGVSEAPVLRQEIAAAVARVLGVERVGRGGGGETAGQAVSPDAYDAYLRGRREQGQMGFDRAIARYEQAIALDSTFALAYAALAEASVGRHLFDPVPLWEISPRARDAAEHAIELDPSLPEAHMALGLLHQLQWEWREAERELWQAVRFGGGMASAHRRYAEHLCLVGRHDDAVHHARAALLLDPLSARQSAGLGDALVCAGRYDEAVRQLERTVEWYPDDRNAYESLGFAYLWQGAYAKGIAAMRAFEARGWSPDPERSVNLAMAFALAGDAAAARRILGRIEGDPRKTGAMEFALVHAALGDAGRALDYLEEAYQKHDGWLVYLQTPFFRSLRGQPRYQALVQRMGFPGSGE